MRKNGNTGFDDACICCVDLQFSNGQNTTTTIESICTFLLQEAARTAKMSFNTSDKRFSIEEENIADLTSVIAEFPDGDDNPKKLPIKKLQRTFDDVAKSNSDEGCMKIYIRIRPSTKSEMTMKILSDVSIAACAPEESKRAMYTKMEERVYVCLHFV